MFTVAVITFRIRTFLLILSLPSLLFVVLNSLSMPRLIVINGLMMYAFALSLASIVLLVIRFFRQHVYLFEQQLVHLTRHDSLTGAYSRAYLGELAERELALAKRHDRSLAIAMLDIDCILPEISQTEALLCMDRLRLSLAGLSIETAQGALQFTVSIGVALLIRLTRIGRHCSRTPTAPCMRRKAPAVTR